MKHLSEGILRAHIDDALSTGDAAEVQRHLRTCARCAERASDLRVRAARVHALISQLEPAFTPEPARSDLVQNRFAAYGREKKEERMVRNPFSKRYRLAWVAAVLALLTGVTLSVPPVRSLAGNLLAVFRVENIQFRPMDAESLPDEEDIAAVAPEIEHLFGDTLAVVSDQQPHDVTESEAKDLASFSVRLPHGREAARHEWTPPTRIEMAIDLPQLQAIFTELGYSQTPLPKELDGSTLEANLSGILTSYFGQCEEPTERKCVRLVQMASPEVSIPEGLDVQELGRVYLELLGTPAGEAAALSEQIDWTSTLVLPFPHHVNLTHETIPLDGTEGTLIHSESDYRPGLEYLLTWVKDGVIYGIVGQGDQKQALDLASGLR